MLKLSDGSEHDSEPLVVEPMAEEQKFSMFQSRKLKDSVTRKGLLGAPTQNSEGF